MHAGRADPYDCFKRKQLERIIFVSGGLRSRDPLFKPALGLCVLNGGRWVAADEIILHRIISVVWWTSFPSETRRPSQAALMSVVSPPEREGVMWPCAVSRR